MDSHNEISTNKVPLAAKVDPAVLAAVEKLARDDDRSLSNMVERLLKTNPQVQEVLDATEVAVA